MLCAGDSKINKLCKKVVVLLHLNNDQQICTVRATMTKDRRWFRITQWSASFRSTEAVVSTRWLPSSQILQLISIGSLKKSVFSHRLALKMSNSRQNIFKRVIIE